MNNNELIISKQYSYDKFNAANYNKSGIYNNIDENGNIDILLVLKEINLVISLLCFLNSDDTNIRKEKINILMNDLKDCFNQIFESFERDILISKVQNLEEDVNKNEQQIQNLNEKIKILENINDTLKSMISVKSSNEWISSDTLLEILKILKKEDSLNEQI